MMGAAKKAAKEEQPEVGMMSNRLRRAVPIPLTPIEGLSALLEQASPAEWQQLDLILERTLLLAEAVTRPEARTSST